MKRKKPTKSKKATKKVIDIKTRRRKSVSPSVLAMAEQLIGMEDVREILQVLGDISNEGWSPRLLPAVANTPKIQQQVHDIIYDAVEELYRLEESLITKRSK